MEDFTIIQGNSCYITVIKKDEAGTKINFVEGDEVVLSAKKNLKQNTYDIQSNSTTLVDGELIIYLTPDDTNIPLNEYYYDIQYKDTNEDIYTLTKGKLTIDWSVTEYAT